MSLERDVFLTAPQAAFVPQQVMPSHNGYIDPAAEGQKFYTKGSDMLENIIRGEKEARLGYMVAALAGVNVVYFGAPGAGKTNLLHYGPLLFEGVGPNGLKFLPPQSDLTGKEVSGGTIISTKQISTPAGRTTETTETTIDPILHPEIEILNGDEINRTNPLAVGAALEALESHRVVNNTGEHELKRMQFAAFAYNPPGLDKNVFKMSSALVSRLPIGVHMGSNPNDVDNILDAIMVNDLIHPENMSSVTNFQKIEAMRKRAEAMMVPQETQLRAKQIIMTTRFVMEQCGIQEGIGRLGFQMKRVAAALAVLGGNSTIQSGDFMQAAKFGFVSRVGASDKNFDAHEIFRTHVLERLQPTEKEYKSWEVSQLHPTKLAA